MPWAEGLPGGLYRACWRDAAGRQRSKSGFTHPAMARRYAGEQESKTRRGEAGYVSRSITWAEWLPTWTELRLVEASTSNSDTARIVRWLEPRWGKVPLARIEPEDVQLWVNYLSTEMAPASVAKVYRLLSSSLKAAVKSKRLAVSPCRQIELPTVPPADERFFTRDEIDAAVDKIKPVYAKVMVIILVGTGMRFGELAGLHHHRIDWEAMTIDVHETWDGSRIKAYPKGRQKRRVPMASWVADAILSVPAKDVKTCGLDHERGSRCRSGLVLTGPRGAPLNARNMLRRHFQPALARAGLDHGRQHDLRHTTASWLIQNGRSMAEVAAVLGHTDEAVTARYAHLAGTHMEAVRSVLEGLPRTAAPSLPLDLESGLG